MRKNSLKRIFAALALSAVATTSVASISAFAEGTEDTSTEVTTPSEDTSEDPSEDAAVAEVGPTADGGFYYEDVAGNLILATAEEIAASAQKPALVVDTVESEAGAEVTINVTLNSGDWNSTGFHVNYDTANLELVDAQFSMDVLTNMKLTTKLIEPYEGGRFFTTAGSDVAGVTEYAVLTFKVTDAAQPGEFYPVTVDYVKGDLFSSTTFDETTKQLATAYAFTQGITNGGVQIPEEETQAPTDPTDAPTQAPTDAPTQAPTDAPTQAPTTTTAPPKTESPKTGVAGVGVAAAGLVVAAGAAFVLRKKED